MKYALHLEACPWLLAASLSCLCMPQSPTYAASQVQPASRAHLAHTARRPLSTPTLIGSWGDWHAATHRAAGAVVCYAYTRMVKSEPVIPGRTAIVLTVTERPGSPRDAVALSAGFVYPAASAVQVTAGKTGFVFYTADRSAFARSGVAVVSAFERAGRTGGAVTARSPSPHGVTVTDVFGLTGFDEAHAAIVKACPAHV